MPDPNRLDAHRLVLLVCTAASAIAATPDRMPAQEPVELAPSARFDAEPFSQIRGLVDLGGDAVVVVDQIEDAVYRVHIGRGTRSRIGRSGAGPGEYDSPTDVGVWAGDSLLITDLGNGRLVVVGADLEASRTMPMVGEGYSLPHATDRAGRMYFDRGSALRVARGRGSTTADRASIIRWDPGAARTDTVGSLRFPAGTSALLPERDAWAVGRDGRIAIVRNQDEYRVDWVLPDRTVTGAVVAEPRVRLTAQDREMWLEREAGGGGAVGTADQPVRARDLDLPSAFPYVEWEGVWVDGAGRAWVARNQSLVETRPLLDVFDDTGRRIAQVRLPADRTVVGVGASSLWAVHVDDVGFQWLERYDTSSLTRE